MTVLAYLSKRALRTVDRIDAYWLAHADNPFLFSDELEETIHRLQAVPTIGLPYPTKARPAMRRLLLPKSKCHVYYETDEAGQTLTIIDVWDGRRRPPKL